MEPLRDYNCDRTPEKVVQIFAQMRLLDELIPTYSKGDPHRQELITRYMQLQKRLQNLPQEREQELYEERKRYHLIKKGG